MNITRRDSPFHPLGVLVVFLVAVTLHAGAGIADAGHATWRPVGHLTVFVAFWWLLAVLAAVDGLRPTGGARVLAGVVLVLSLGGLGLLFST